MPKNIKSNKKDKLEILLIMILLGIAAFAASQLINIFWNYRVAENAYDDLATQYVHMQESAVVTSENNTNDAQSLEESSSKDNVFIETNWYEYASVDVRALQTLNSDIIGWILFENEDISLPVMYSGDNETYLKQTYDKKYNSSGSIFMDKDNHPDFTDWHTILYGHNMKNLSMFGKLKYYTRDPSYYENHKYFQIFTADEIRRYEIFAYETVIDGSSHFRVDFTTKEEYTSFLEQINQKAADESLHAVSSDSVVTLATCSTSGEDNRFLVHAKLVAVKELE